MKLYPKLNVQQIRNSLYIGVSIIVLTIIIISPNIPLDVFAQKNINLKILKIHFEAIQFNYDHDSTRGRGEIFLTASVNEQKIQLIEGQDILQGEKIFFKDLKEKSNELENEATIAIPLNEELKISINGHEKDGIDNIPIPIIGMLTDLGNYFDFDDKLGIVSEKYDINDNFGVGEHKIISQFDGENENTKNDYIIYYSIAEL